MDTWTQIFKVSERAYTFLHNTHNTHSSSQAHIWMVVVAVYCWAQKTEPRDQSHTIKSSLFSRWFNTIFVYNFINIIIILSVCSVLCLVFICRFRFFDQLEAHEAYCDNTKQKQASKSNDEVECQTKEQPSHSRIVFSFGRILSSNVWNI